MSLNFIICGETAFECYWNYNLKAFINVFQISWDNGINWIIFCNIFLSNNISIFLQCTRHQLQSEIDESTEITNCFSFNDDKFLRFNYLSLMDKCVPNHSIIFSFDHPAATCGLARSFPAYPNSKSKIINGDIGPSISIDFLDNSSGVKVIKLDRARSVLKSNEFLVFLE